ncbi:MAG: GlsB/YeaQ/YmgE family stress response membrane protein [Nitrospirae bacterium]|nr:GlsB/YeaQ/YmgE family stress response membrane protein [Candidatus Manganitrophaceae bacterium]
MGILGWIVFGAIVGIVAKFLMPGHDPGGFVVTILLGIVGALIGGFLGRAVGLYGPDQQAGGFIMSVVGAIIVLWGYRLMIGRSTA